MKMQMRLDREQRSAMNTVRLKERLKVLEEVAGYLRALNKEWAYDESGEEVTREALEEVKRWAAATLENLRDRK